MITVKFQGRLGNNMFQYATLCSVAARRGLTPAFESWSGAKLFALPHHPTPTRADRHNTFTEANPQKVTQDVFDIHDNTELVGFFQAEEYFRDMRPELLRRFSPREGWLRKLQEKRAAYTEPLIVVHQREGDYVGSTFPVMNESYFGPAMERAQQFLGTDKGPVVLVSDNPGTHVLDFVGKPRLTKLNTDELESLYMLMTADVSILSASGFSWWGGWLNQRGRVIAPERWIDFRRDTATTWYPPGIRVDGWTYIP